MIEFLKSFQAMPRTYNAYRSHIRELMRYAEERGWREPGTNPVDSLRTMTVKARTRYITDSEMRRIKVGACFLYTSSPVVKAQQPRPAMSSGFFISRVARGTDTFFGRPCRTLERGCRFLYPVFQPARSASLTWQLRGRF